MPKATNRSWLVYVRISEGRFFKIYFKNGDILFSVSSKGSHGDKSKRSADPSIVAKNLKCP